MTTELQIPSVELGDDFVSQQYEKPKIVTTRPRLSDFESLMVGAIGGVVETSLQMPLITWKIVVQEGRSYPKHFLGWYRGVFINASSLAPITAVQCWANSILQNLLLLNDKTRKLTDIEQLMCSAGAGAISGFIYGPVDLMVIQQQKMEASLLKAFGNISRDYGALKVYRGLGSTMIRESIYTMGYLGIAPVIQSRMVNSQNTWFESHPVATSVLSACMGGTIAAILTHPVDTAKTCIQSDLVGSQYKSLMPTTSYLYNKGGLPLLFKGVIPRTLRLCGACFVISQVREKMTDLKVNGYLS